MMTIPRPISAFTLCLAAALSHAQPAVQWQKCLGGSNEEWAYSTQQTTDGGYILTGYTRSTDGDITGNHGLRDFWVVKVDTIGSLQWQKCLGGSGDEVANSIQQTPDGGYIVAGFTDSNDGDVSGNHGGPQDGWVVKLDATGSIQWQKCLGGTGVDWVTTVLRSIDGGYILVGRTGSNDGDVSGNHGGMDGWLVKLDASGTMQWQKCFGGTSTDWTKSIQRTTDGGYIVTGDTQSDDGDVSGNHGDYDIWVVKLDISGNMQWQKCLGGANGEWANSIEQTSDGGYIVGGYTQSNDGDVSGNHGGDHDIWVVRLDASGSMQWQKCLGGTDYEEASSVQQTTDGGYLVVGRTSSTDGNVTGNHGWTDGWLVQLDDTGNLEWQLCLGGSGFDGTNALDQIADGVYVIAGQAESIDGDVSGLHGPYMDFWLVKLALVDLGVTEPAPLIFSVAPNPTNGDVRITFPDLASGKELSLIDALGREVLRERVSGGTHTLDVGALPIGTYAIHLRTEDGRNGSQRLTVQ